MKIDRLTDQRLSDEWVYRLVRACFGNEFTAHSLRSTFVTVAKENGADDREIQNQTKHKTSAMIARYDRRRNVRKYNAQGKLGL